MDTLFKEKQHIGFNGFSILRRMVLAIFCFIAYYYSEGREENADLLFLLGIILLVVSVLLLFIVHLKTYIYQDKIVVKGLFSSKVITIQMNDIKEFEMINYPGSLLEPYTFNLHGEGQIKFYTHGNYAMKLVTQDGNNYIIGTNKPIEFLSILNKSKL